MPIPNAWVLAEPWVIRDPSNGNFIVHNTHSDPAPLNYPHQPFPRLFRSEEHAKNFLVQWRRGKHVMHYEDGLDITPIPHRVNKVLEIIPLKLVRDPT